MSVGSNGSALQRAATDSIFAVVQAAGLSPRQMEKNEWSAEQPLRAIRRVIDECHGAVIVAFTRYQFRQGTEYKKNDQQGELHDVKLPTVWNQIEAALAYGRDLPLLVVCEHGLRDDGLLEGRYDWKVFWTDFSPSHIASEEFTAYVGSWKRLVDQHSSSSNASNTPKDLDLSKVSIAKLVGMLTTPQIAAVVASLAAAFTAVAAAAFKLGRGAWPWQ